MIDYELFSKIKYYHEKKGLSVNQIATELSLDARTVVKWLSEKNLKPRARAQRASKLDPFKQTIVRMLEQHPYTGVQIFQRVQKEGFTGGYTIVKRYVKKVRPPKVKAYLKLSFAPGECAQVDWGSYGSIEVGNTKRRLSFFVMVLCYSRMMYVEFTVSQTMEHFLGCHQNAFQFFGCVPEKVMVDNLKSAVIKRIVGEGPIFNKRYLDFAHHYGFTIKACGVRKGNEKGRVENGVGYVKKNLLNGLTITSLEALNLSARNWLDDIANVRVHGATRQRPIDNLPEEQKSTHPLPVNDYDIATVKPLSASSQFRIAYDGNHYSVPAEYAGTLIILKAYPDRLCLYYESRLIARHVRSYTRGKDFENPDHPKALLKQRKNAKEQKIFARFLTLSFKSEAYYKALTERRMNPKHHIQKIVALSEIYGTEAVRFAIEDAFSLQAFSSEYIANILEQRATKLPVVGALHLTRRELLDLEIPSPDLNIYKTDETTEENK